MYVNRNISLPVNPGGFHRIIMNEKNWVKWWPGKKDQDAYLLNDHRFRIIDKRINALVIEISSDHLSDTSFLNIIHTGNDSVSILWQANIESPASPFNRIGKYFSVTKLNKDMKHILDSMRTYYSDQLNIYEIDIRKEKVVDSTLLQNFAITKGYPGIEFIYSLIDQLQEYAKSKSARQTGYPMLNINTEDSINFITKVAIPVDKRLESSGNISYKWMLGGGNILVTDVKGGPATIKHAFEKLEEYITDNKRIPPAIPFESLITDRSREKDTSKWITRIYYPVM